MMNNSKDRSLKFLLQYFFKNFLPSHRGLSQNTIASYKEAFKLFTPWLMGKVGNKNPTIDDVTLFSVLEFLQYLEGERGNGVHSRNARLAAIKCFFRMCYLLHQDTKKTFEAIQFIPFKRAEKPLIDFFEHDDALKILKSINIKCSIGFRNYAIINALYDTGMRASEITNLKIINFDRENNSLEIIGKGNKWRKIDIWPRTSRVLEKYLREFRGSAKPLYKDYLFINQRGSALTRFGVHKLCQKQAALIPDLKKPFISAKRSAVHSWRHSAAINMIHQGRSLLEVKVRLGHASYDTTAKYLALDLSIKQKCMKTFIEFTKRFIDEGDLTFAADWTKKKDVIDYINSL